MNYRLLAFDLDGTLTNSEKKITPKTEAALMRAQENGVKVILASGRPTYGILPLAEQLKLAEYGGYILSYNGGKIVDCRSRDIVFQKTLPEDRLYRVFEAAEKYGLAVMTYENDTIITEEPENEFVKIESRTCHLPIKQVVHMQEAINFPVVKFLLVAEGDYLAGVEARVREELGEGFEVYRSAPFFLEIVSTGIDKGACLQYILDREHLTREELMAFGDSYNDETMIRFAGKGVAMGNAVPEIKAVADHVTGTNEEDGIAQALEQFLQF